MKYVKINALLPVQEDYIPGTWNDNKSTKDQIESQISNSVSDSFYDDDCILDISFVDDDTEMLIGETLYNSEANDNATFVYGMCDMSVAAELPENEAIEMLSQNILMAPDSVTYYLSNARENIGMIERKIKEDLLKMLDHECEVFDPICDGPVELGEGIGMAREFIENYFKERGI